MHRSWSVLAELLSGKTPEAMYDALHAGRYLSELGMRSPSAVLEFIKAAMVAWWQRPLIPDTNLQRLAAALADSDFLNEAGKRLANEEVPGVQ
jgi:hypothetical protein